MQPCLFVLMRAQPVSRKSRPRRKRIGFGRVEVTYSVGRSGSRSRRRGQPPRTRQRAEKCLGFRRERRGGTGRAGGRAAVRSTGVKRCASSELTGVHTIKHLKRGAWRFPAFCILCAYVVVRSKYLLRVPPFFRPSFKLEIGRRNPRGATESTRPRPPRRRQRGRTRNMYSFCGLFLPPPPPSEGKRVKRGTTRVNLIRISSVSMQQVARHITDRVEGKEGGMEGERDPRRGRSAGSHSEFLRHISLDAEVRTRH